MYTSLVFVALTGSLTTGESLSVASPTWHKDYVEARHLAEEAHKPLAVFVGRGEEGYAEVSRQGQLNGPVSKLLGKDYVCLYVDTATEEGKELAAALELPRRGVVL